MPRKAVYILLLGGVLLLTLGVLQWTHYTKQRQVTDNPLVARVYNRFLYKNDLDRLHTATNSAEDRKRIIDDYVQEWVSKQLLIVEAEAYGGYNKAEIEQRVLNYRHDLLTHHFIQKLVNSQIDREVSDEEIASYHQAHQEDFVLRSSIFSGRLVIVPKDAPNRVRLRSLLMGKSEEQLVALKRYCLQFANNYVLDETIWQPWEELIIGTSLKNNRDKTALLRQGKLVVASDSKQYYYFKINDYRLVGNVSPLELVSDQIADLIIYKRKIALADKIKKDLLQRAMNNNNCVIYEH